jgi:hypothetical protein
MGNAAEALKPGIGAGRREEAAGEMTRVKLRREEAGDGGSERGREPRAVGDNRPHRNGARGRAAGPGRFNLNLQPQPSTSTSTSGGARRGPPAQSKTTVLLP